MRIVVVSRENLNKPIEDLNLPHHEGSFVSVMKNLVPSYNSDTETYLSLYLNGQKIEKKDWEHLYIETDDDLKFVIEPGGLETGAILAIIAVVMAVASAVYAMCMMNKLGKNKQKDTKSSRSIYDVNAQGNQVKLQEIVPENFGFFKHFPDYLADRHSFYRNNTFFVDMILCQGIGYYDYKADHSDIYIGETPINELKGCSAYIIEPGVEITANNSPEDESWFCWYSSTEVTATGHTLKGVTTTQDSKQRSNVNNTFSGSTFSGTYYETYSHGGVGCDGTGRTTGSIKKNLDLGWDVGSVIEIKDMTDTRLISNTMVSCTTSGSSTILKLTKASTFTMDEYLRARVTTTDPDTGEEVITSNGDYVWVYMTASSSITYKTPGGTSGPTSHTDTATNTEGSLCEILAISVSGKTITLTLDATSLPEPTYPDYPSPSLPILGEITSREQSLSCSVTEAMPADYPYSDNGYYEITAHENNVYTVKRLNDSYGDVNDWPGFFSTGINQSDAVFTLIEGSSSEGGYVGPYRACPYGATSNTYEIDINFPSGLGKLNDDGEFDDLSCTLQIEYRKAGSDDEYTVLERSWTNHTNDELGYTLRFTTKKAGNYEFRIIRTSEMDGSTKALEECKWVGLKSVISTVNKYDGMTVLICRFKGNETLSELSENQLATYWTRKLPVLGGTTLVATRDIAPVVQYIVKNSKYKNILDSESLAEFDTLWKSQGLHCDGSIDSDSTLLESLRDVLNVGFASPVVRDNTLSFKRLYQGAQPVQIFTKQNLTASPTIIYSLPKEDDVNEIVVEYTSPQTYKTETIYCHINDAGAKEITTYPCSDHQETLNAWGVTDRDHAIALGMRRLRYLNSTRVTYELKTELNGLNCQYNDLVGLVLDENLSNITGRVLSVDVTLRIVELDMEIPESLETGIIYISKTDGSFAQLTYQRRDSHHVKLDTALPFEWHEDYGSAIDYPFFAIGELLLCWVTEVKPQSGNKCTLKLINYSEDIFTDDIEEA